MKSQLYESIPEKGCYFAETMKEERRERIISRDDRSEYKKKKTRRAAATPQ